jgi:hypothetical protein
MEMQHATQAARPKRVSTTRASEMPMKVLTAAFSR